MRLIGLKVSNFRCYRDPVSIRFDDLTALVGRNDVGKSSLMDALSIFFESSKPDRDDACKSGDPAAMKIACEFDELPDQIVVDTDFPTTLAAEHLLSPGGTLIIEKTFNGSLKTPTITSIAAIAHHPTAAGFADLLTLKKTDLAKRAADLNVDLAQVDKRVNALVRAAIRGAAPDLVLGDSIVPLDTESGKQVYAALQPYLPAFALFKSDRASTDQDDEAQDPLKAAIAEALKAVEVQLQQVQDFVLTEVKKIAAATVSKLREMDPSVAETLDPVISTKPWTGVFSTSITGDEGIPLNKRGSGVKRLVLLNFFRAKAESEAVKKNANSVIYAIEEPETSQHPRNQRLLLNALRDLANGDGRQVIITTHTPMLARYLPETSLRYIQKVGAIGRTVTEGSAAASDEIARSLGVLPDHNVKLFIGVEGPNDISFLNGISQILIAAGEDVPNLTQLELDGEIIFIPLGGSNLAVWASRLTHLNRPEFHLCDRDNQPPAAPKYADHIAAVNARPNCYGCVTGKRELENYLHPDAVVETYAQNGVGISFPGMFADFDDVPTLVAEKVCAVGGGNPWAGLSEEKRKEKSSQAKRQLNRLAVARMTAARLAAADPAGEVRGWLTHIRQKLLDFDA